MSKRIKRIVDETVQRWQETIKKPSADTDAAKKILATINKKAKIFVVDTPVQFYVAQAIMRGRISKVNATAACDKLNIDSEFVKDIQRVGGTKEIVFGNRWFRNEVASITDSMLQAHLSKITGMQRRRIRRWRTNGNDVDGTVARFMLSDLASLHDLMLPQAWNMRHRSEPEKTVIADIRNHLAFRSARVHRSELNRYNAVSGVISDILAGEFDPNRHWFDAVHAEILAKALNIKDTRITAYNEIFHHVPAIMQFLNGFLILGNTPTISLNADNLLHNETGPAISYSDGRKYWFLNGHELQQLGETIVMHPEKLKVEDINKILNEEEKRIAIDKIGWARYLQETKAKIADHRENWVDNTVEVLIKPAKTTTHHWQDEPLRMVLSCRSTGRKYFIGVPNAVAAVVGNAQISRMLPAAEQAQEIAIKTCDLAQKWMANGGTCQHLPYATKELNIVGAS